MDERVGDAPHEGHCVEDGGVVYEGWPDTAAGHEAEEEHEGLEDAVGGEGGDPGAAGGAQVGGQPAADETAEAEDGDDEGQVMDAEHLRNRTLQSLKLSHRFAACGIFSKVLLHPVNPALYLKCEFL